MKMDRRFYEAQREQKRLNKLTLRDASAILDAQWAKALEHRPELPELLPTNLVTAINDVIACVL